MELVLFLVVLDVELSPSVAVSCLPILDIGVLMLSHHSLALHLLMQGVLCFGVHRCSDPGGGGLVCILCQHSAPLPWQRCWRLPGCGAGPAFLLGHLGEVCMVLATIEGRAEDVVHSHPKADVSVSKCGI